MQVSSGSHLGLRAVVSVGGQSNVGGHWLPTSEPHDDGRSGVRPRVQYKERLQRSGPPAQQRLQVQPSSRLSKYKRKSLRLLRPTELNREVDICCGREG